MPQFATSVTAATPIPENRLRRSLHLFNDDATDKIFLDAKKNAAITAATASIVLNAKSGFSLNINSDGEFTLTGSFQAIASANTPNLIWFETEDIRR